MRVAYFNSAKWCSRSLESLLLPSMTKIHCYCLWFLSPGRAIPSRKEKTPLPSASADCTPQGQLHTLLLPSWHLQEGHHRPCLTCRAMAFQDEEHKLCHHLSSNTLGPCSTLQANSHVPYNLAWGCSSASLAITLNTDKGVAAIKKHLYCPLQCK